MTLFPVLLRYHLSVEACDGDRCLWRPRALIISRMMHIRLLWCFSCSTTTVKISKKSTGERNRKRVFGKWLRGRNLWPKLRKRKELKATVEVEGELDYCQVVLFCFLSSLGILLSTVVIASAMGKLGKSSDLCVPAPLLL